jgi:hypothetical protein
MQSDVFILLLLIVPDLSPLLSSLTRTIYLGRCDFPVLSWGFIILGDSMLPASESD